MQEAGIDEAGRGSLAGPVVASMVILCPKLDNSLFKDSKQIKENERIKLYQILIQSNSIIRTTIIGHKIIDRINILNATLLAMKKCIEKINIIPQKIYIDGDKKPNTSYKNIETVIKGDQKLNCISAASIIAKVTRDKIMKKLHKKFSSYEFDINKGYGTKRHFEHIFTYGLSPVHRKSFHIQKQLSLF